MKTNNRIHLSGKLVDKCTKINFLYTNNNRVEIFPICNTNKKYKIVNNKPNKKYV